MVDACVHLIELSDEWLAPLLQSAPPPLVNVGCGTDLTIAELAELVRRLVGCDARVDWDRAKPDGTPRKLLDVSRLAALGWKAKIPLEEGIRRVCAEYAGRRQVPGVPHP